MYSNISSNFRSFTLNHYGSRTFLARSLARRVPLAIPCVRRSIRQSRPFRIFSSVTTIHCFSAPLSGAVMNVYEIHTAATDLRWVTCAFIGLHDDFTCIGTWLDVIIVLLSLLLLFVLIFSRRARTPPLPPSRQSSVATARRCYLIIRCLRVHTHTQHV